MIAEGMAEEVRDDITNPFCKGGIPMLRLWHKVFGGIVGVIATCMLTPTPQAAGQPGVPKAAVSLKVGDSAPDLKADKWWNGDSITQLKKGNVYVVEFWATWCGPCIVMMPHLSELQEKYKDQGVIFIGYTARDPNNTLAKVTTFVEKRGRKLKYRLAYSEDRGTYDAWMKAAGRGGIPCCFVVDRQGKIAYIGHPMYLDVVLPKVVADKWKLDDLAEVEKVEQEVDSIFAATRNPEEFLKKLETFEKNHPDMRGIPYFNAPRILSLLQLKRVEQAQKTAEQILDQALRREDPAALQTLVSLLTSPQASQHKELVALALRSAQGLLKLNGDKDPVALYFVAEAHFASGDVAKAKEWGAKALEAAEQEPQLKRQIQQRISRYDK
jgi:thiol-disulfide isomerase/thioredoxin